MQPEKVRNHLLRYWARAKTAFSVGDFPQAAFLAVTLIEEVGKVVLLGNATLTGELNEKHLRSHHEKYIHAVGATLFVNSRVTRIYGDEEKRFAKWFREGELFRIRNSALYLEGTEVLVTPDEAILPKDAFLLVCIAGEVLAEIQGAYTGTGPNEWRELLEEVDRFRTEYDFVQ